jgi:hypothetical protein
MIRTTAESVLDLRMSTPSWVDDRAVLCAPNLIHFDAIAGFLQFQTQCAGSRNSWVQTIVFNDWESIVSLRMPWGPLMPETDEERMTREKLEEETTILGTESWQDVLAKFPELINMDLLVDCSCPAFLWYGSEYALTERDTALFPEGVPYPHVRDRNLSNIICKHLAAVFEHYF